MKYGTLALCLVAVASSSVVLAWGEGDAPAARTYTISDPDNQMSVGTLEIHPFGACATLKDLTHQFLRSYLLEEELDFWSGYYYSCEELLPNPNGETLNQITGDSENGYKFVDVHNTMGGGFGKVYDLV